MLLFCLSLSFFLFQMEIKLLFKGSVLLAPNFSLHGVLHVPTFKLNLLSIPKLLAQTPCVVNFTKTQCIFQDQFRKIIANGNLVDGLFMLQGQSYNSSHSSNSLTGQSAAIPSKFSSDLWHKRLGHPSLNTLNKIPQLSHVFHSKTINHTCISFCSICPLAKQHKLSFPVSSSQSTSCFDLVHCDLWGPYIISAMNGCRYFLTLVDDYSRCVWTFLMPTKFHVLNILQNFVAFVQNQFQTTIKILRTDNGSELFNHSLASFLTQLGIIHQSSCPYTPQQNGVVERKHQQLLEMARALRFQSFLPKHFWGYCPLVPQIFTFLLSCYSKPK